MMDQRKKLEQQLIEKALKDESFRQQLLGDPKGVIETEFGFKIPEAVQVKVLEENENTFYIVLPRGTKNSEMELTDAELTTVAGGAWSLEYCPSLEEC